MMPAQLAIGTMIQQGDGATPTENWTTIGGVRSITGPSFKSTIKDITSHDSPGRMIQRKTTLNDPGDLKFKINWDPNDVTHQLLIGDWQNFQSRHYRFVLPTTPAVKWMLTAAPSDFSTSEPVDDVLMADITLTNFQAPQFVGVP